MRKHWVMGLVTMLLAVCVVFGLMTSVAYAAISNVDVNGVTLNADTTGTWSYDSANAKITCSTSGAWSTKNSTLTIANNSGAPVTVRFDFDYTNTITVTTPTATYTSAGSVNEVLANGKSITVKSTTSFLSGATVTITNFSVSSATETRTLNLQPVAEGGSYTVKVGDGETQTISTTAGTASFSPVDSITLTAAPADGYMMYRWLIDGNYYTDRTVTLSGLSDQASVKLEFLPDTYNVVYNVGSNWHYNWEDAMKDAVSSGNVVILAGNLTLPGTKADADAAGEVTGTYVKETNGKMVYEVPSGVTFLIPYDSSNSTNDLLGDGDYAETAPSAGSVYRTLKVAQGATVNVNGNFVVNAKRSSATGPKPQGNTSGSYGKLILAGTMNVNSGATLVARGYIVDENHTSHNYGNGTGRLYAKNGSTVKILFQVINHRGGTATKDVKDDVMPINNYTIASIMMHTEYEYGSTLKADYQVVISMSVLGVRSFPGTLTLLSSGSDGLFLTKAASGDLLDAKVIMDYDYANDRTVIVIPQGRVDMANIKLSNLAGMGVTIDTAASQLPFADNMAVYIGGYPDGTAAEKAVANVTYSTKMLPAAQINVMGNGTMNIPAGSSLFAYDADDYLDTWSNGKLRTRINIPDVASKNTRVKPTTDAKVNVYSGGTINIDGEFGQSASLNEAITAVGEGAKLNLNQASAAAVPTTEVYEAVSTSSTPFLYPSWKVLNGRLAGISTDADGDGTVDYTDFSSAGTGSYRSALIDGVNYWYKYAITFNVTVEGGGTKTITKYICNDSLTFNPCDELGDGRYVITGVTCADFTPTAGAEDPNGAKDVSNGWENLVFSGINKDTTVNVTVKPFTYRVQYTDNASAAVTEYISGTTFSHSWEAAPVLIEAEFTDWDGNQIDVSWDTAEQLEPKKLTTVNADLSCDTKIAFTTNAEIWKVTWNVTDASGNTTSEVEYVEKGGKTTYSVAQPTDGWRIIEQEPVINGTFTKASNAGTAFTVEGVGSEMTVDLTLTAYDRRVSLTLISDNAGDTVSIEPSPYYFNGNSISFANTDIISANGSRYTFKEAESLTVNYAVASATKEQLSISNVTNKEIALSVNVEKYDAVVTIRQNGSVVLKDYYSSGDEIVHSFGSMVKIDRCVKTEREITSVYSGYTNPAIAEDGSATNASVTLTAGSDDIELDVNTSKFAHIVQVIDGMNDPYLSYTTGTAFTYTCADHYYAADASVSGSGSAAVAGIGTEDVTLSNITGNPTLNVTLQKYATKVTWYNRANSQVLKTSYIIEIQDANGTDTYTCDPKTVAWAEEYPADVTVKPDEGETITVTGIKAGNEIQIGLKLYDYAYKVQFNDGAEGKTIYVDADGQEVFDGAAIAYTAESGSYFTAYTFTEGTADVDETMNLNSDVADGWEKLKLSGIQSDVTVDLTMGTYDHRVTWKAPGAGVEKMSYVTGTENELVLDEIYTITEVDVTPSDKATASFSANTAKVTGLSGDVTVTVKAQDYKYKITWIVDGVTGEPVAINEDQLVWTIPETDPEKTFVVVSAEITLGTGEVEHTNKTVTVTPTTDVTVKIVTEEALTNYKALWGDMSYRYYKNGAFYAWDGEAYTWRMIDQYAWTHKSGSVNHYYADLNESGKVTPYTVPNGSVMIVNPTNQTITATVSIELVFDATTWVTQPVFTWNAEDGTSAVGQITVTLKPHSTMLISGVLEGTPVNNLTDQVTGSCSVSIEPID